MGREKKRKKGRRWVDDSTRAGRLMGRKVFAFDHVFRAEHFWCFHIMSAYCFCCSFYGVLALLAFLGFVALFLVSETIRRSFYL